MGNYYDQITVYPEIPLQAIHPVEIRILEACGFAHRIEDDESTDKEVFFYVDENVGVLDRWALDDPDDLLDHLISTFDDPQSVDGALGPEFNKRASRPSWVDLVKSLVADPDTSEGEGTTSLATNDERVMNLYIEVLRSILERLDPSVHPYVELQTALTADAMEPGEYGGIVTRVYRDKTVTLQTNRIADNIEEIAMAARQVIDSTDATDAEEARDMLDRALERTVPDWKDIPAPQTLGPL